MDVILILVATPVRIGGGSAPSAVLCEGGGRIDLVGKEKKGGPKGPIVLLPGLLDP